MPRMKFIPALREQVIDNYTSKHIGSRAMWESALEQWDSNQEPRNPFEYGAFEVFRSIQKDIEDA